MKKYVVRALGSASLMVMGNVAASSALAAYADPASEAVAVASADDFADENDKNADDDAILPPIALLLLLLLLSGSTSDSSKVTLKVNIFIP